VAYRVITGNLVPDHATIARFICRHAGALAELFSEALKLCARAGLVRPGVVSIDGTRIAGNASPEVNYEFEQIAREIVAEVRATDEAEDEEFGEARGDELPEQVRTAEGRREFFRRAREQMRRERESPEPVAEPEAEATAGEIVDGRGRPGGDDGIAEGDRRDHRPKLDPPRVPGQPGERRPEFERIAVRAIGVREVVGPVESGKAQVLCGGRESLPPLPVQTVLTLDHDRDVGHGCSFRVSGHWRQPAHPKGGPASSQDEHRVHSVLIVSYW